MTTSKRYIDQLPHSCGTARGLNVIEIEEDGKRRIEGYCFKCKKVVPNPYGEDVDHSKIKTPPRKTPEQIAEEMEEVKSWGVHDVFVRKLRSSTLDYFGAKVGLSEEDGKTPEIIAWPGTKDGEVIGYKLKYLDKKFQYIVGTFKDVDPIGWEQAKESGADTLIITEGEEDMASVQRALDVHTKKEYEDRKPAVVSLPFGVNSTSKWLPNRAGEIMKRFKNIIICFDNDKPGEEAAAQALNYLPNATSVTFPLKDANDMLKKGLVKKMFNMLTFEAKKPKNSRLINSLDLHDKAKEPPKFGELTWPWKAMNEKTRGIRYGETIYIGAGVKMGKSEIVNALGAHFIQNHGVKVFMAKPEEDNAKTYKMVAGKIVGKKFHDPKVEFDEKAFDKAGEIIGDKLYVLNLYQHVGWDTLKLDIIAAVGQGVKAVFIDPITNLTNGVEAGQANTELQRIAQEASALALDLNIVVFLFCHLKAYEGNISDEKRDKLYSKHEYVGITGAPHEWGGRVMSSQFAGSRAMMRSCNYMLGLEGNKDEKLEDAIRRIRHLTILEDREFGEVGHARLMWDPHTTMFREIT